MPRDLWWSLGGAVVSCERSTPVDLCFQGSKPSNLMPGAAEMEEDEEFDTDAPLMGYTPTPSVRLTGLRSQSAGCLIKPVI